MSLILFMESENGDVPIQVEPDDDFETFLSRAKESVNREIDITSIVGDENISMSDNVYQFMLRAALNCEDGSSGNISHEIIDISDSNVPGVENRDDEEPDTEVTKIICKIEDDGRNQEKIVILENINPKSRYLLNDNKIEQHIARAEQQKVINLEPNTKQNDKSLSNRSNNNCCFCGCSIVFSAYLSYIFDNKDQAELRKSKHRRSKGLAKISCDTCLKNDFTLCSDMPSHFDKESYLVIRNNMQYFYRKKYSNVQMRNYKLSNIVLEDEFDIKCTDNNSYTIVNTTKQNRPLICRLCKAQIDTFPINHSLDHISSRAEGLVFPCVFCEYGYTSFNELKDHLSSAHSDICPPELTDNSDYQISLVSCESSSERRQGNKGLKLLNELLKKQQREGEPLSDSDKLDTTDEIIQNNSESDAESGVWIIQAKDSSSDKENSDIETEMFESIVQYQCGDCGNQYDTMDIFNQHSCSGITKDDVSTISSSIKLNDEATKPELCQRARVIAVKSDSKSDTTVRDNEQRDSEGQHKCQICHKAFHTKIRLQFHTRYIHNAGSDPSELRCSACPELVFPSESVLYDHIHFTHPKSKRYACPVEGCQREFHMRGVLKNHLVCHNGERTHVCTVCSKQFFDKQTLNEHKVTHLKVKPFQCHICHKYLNRKSRLRMHLLNHQSQLKGCTIYACKTCSAVFSTPNEAESHLNAIGHCLSDTSLESLECEEQVDNPCEMPSTNDSGVSSTDIFEDVPDESSHNDENNPLNVSEGSRMLSLLSWEGRRGIVVVEVEKVFRCEYCERLYWKQEALNAHRVCHQGKDKAYICHVCGATFSSYSRCTTHKTTHGYYKINSPKNKQTESDDPKSNSSVTFKDSFPCVKHFLCEVCNKSYLHWTYLQVHRKLKHSSNVHMYKCVTCGDEFPNSWGVAYHRKKVHGSAPPHQIPNPNTERMQYSCSECGTIVPSKAQLFLHRRSQHPPPPSPPKGDMFPCSACAKRYVTKAGLQGHYRKQHDNSPNTNTHKCKQCGKTFINVSGLNTHVRRVHMKEIKYQCVECGMGFYSWCDLQSHSRRHSGERPFPCHLCAKYFRTKSMRNQHVRIHSGERPFKCDVCGVGFRRAYALGSHRLTHIPDTRSLHCPLCPRVFRLKAELNTHMRHGHNVDPLTYVGPSNAATSIGNAKVKINAMPKVKQSKENVIGCQTKAMDNSVVIINENNKQSSVEVDKNNIESCLFTIFEDDQNNLIDTIEEVQLSTSVFHGENQEIVTESIDDQHLITTAGELILENNNSSNNLCVMSEQGLVNDEIILDTNILPNNQYILNENELIGEISEESTKNSKILEVNGYFSKLVTLNNDSDMGEMKYINIENDLVNKQIEDLSSDLYGSNVVIDKVEIHTDMPMDDDVIDKGNAFVIDWQENEDVTGNEKSLDNCKYFSDN